MRANEPSPRSGGRGGAPSGAKGARAAKGGSEVAHAYPGIGHRLVPSEGASRGGGDEHGLRPGVQERFQRDPHGHLIDREGRLVRSPHRRSAPQDPPSRLIDATLGWSPLLEPGLTLIDGDSRALRCFHHELAHYALHHDPKHVLWCDGAHAFDPYGFAELNLVRGFQADDGAERILVKRCMTPFQWDSVLTQHLDDKLLNVEASLVVVAPFDRLFSTDELTDWEQEDYVQYAVRHLRSLARRHHIPIVMSVDMQAWWRTHPVLAGMAFEAVHRHWTLSVPGDRYRLEQLESGMVLDPALRRRVTLLDFMDLGLEPEATPVAIPVLARRRRARAERRDRERAGAVVPGMDQQTLPQTAIQVQNGRPAAALQRSRPQGPFSAWHASVATQVSA